MTQLLAADFPETRFPDMVLAHAWPEDTLLLAFAPGEYCFDFLKNTSGLPTGTDQGRIFSPQGELRWRRMEDAVRCVYLGENGPEGFKDHSSSLQGLLSEEKKVFLWGVRTDSDPEWIEQQVPHRLTYPLTGEPVDRGRVMLTMENWIDQEGKVVFSRYHSLTESKEEDHASR